MGLVKSDLLKQFRDNWPNFQKKHLNKIFEIFVEEIKNSLKRGEAVEIRSLGRFSVKVQKEKVGRKIDETKKLISWRIIETSNDVMPVNSYAAKIFVKDGENGKTIVNYKAGFYRGFMGNDPPEQLNDENSKKKVSIFIKNSLKGLKSIAESK